MGKQSKQAAYEQAKDHAMKAGICVADIVKVIKYDENKMTVDVQPLTKYPDEDKFEKKPQVLSVPAALVYGGGFVIRPVYEAGDLGFVVYLDRDSDSTIAKGSEADPNTERLHSGDDAIFFGGIRIGSKQITGLPSKKLCLGTDDGSIYIAIGKDKINIKGDVEIEGNVKIIGKEDVTQTVTALVDVIGEGISLKSHVHTDVETGAGTSGPPQGGGA